MSATSILPPPHKIKPVIGLGCSIIWKPDINSQPSDWSAGLVTRAGNVISVILFPPESRIGTIKESVRHQSDPDLHKYVHNQSGCWDYTEDQKRSMGIPIL